MDNAIVRMLSTPIRNCAQSSQYLPSGMLPLLYARTRASDQSIYLDFLIRLSVKRLPSPPASPNRRTYTLVPDGVQHPKFKGLDNRRGHYVACRRSAIQEFDRRGTVLFFRSQPLRKAALTWQNEHSFLYGFSVCFSRGLPSHCARRAQAASFVAGIYWPPAPPAYPTGTGALSRAGAGTPARSRGIPVVAETILERILSRSCR